MSCGAFQVGVNKKGGSLKSNLEVGLVQRKKQQEITQERRHQQGQASSANPLSSNPRGAAFLPHSMSLRTSWKTPQYFYCIIHIETSKANPKNLRPNIDASSTLIFSCEPAYSEDPIHHKFSTVKLSFYKLTWGWVNRWQVVAPAYFSTV